MKRFTSSMAAFITLMCVFMLAPRPGRSDEAKGAMMMMPKAGPEAKALAPVFGIDAAWTGNVEAGAMGPDSQEMTSHGTATGHAILGGMWYTCDVVDTYGASKDAMTWKGHMLVGYDMAAKAYRASCVDNMGALMMFNGTMEGDKFVLETPTEVMMMGQMMKDRLTWDMSDPKAVKFTDEHQSGGGDWKLVESATMRTMVKGQTKPTSAEKTNAGTTKPKS